MCCLTAKTQRRKWILLKKIQGFGALRLGCEHELLLFRIVTGAPRERLKRSLALPALTAISR